MMMKMIVFLNFTVLAATKAIDEKSNFTQQAFWAMIIICQVSITGAQKTWFNFLASQA